MAACARPSKRPSTASRCGFPCSISTPEARAAAPSLPGHEGAGDGRGEFGLVAFGGCGGLAACEIAAELGVRTVVVPEFAGALSALGMLLADNVRDFAVGVLNRTDFERQYKRLERRACGELS